MGHTRSPEEYQALGRAYYSEKQYDKAIEAFTQAIEQAIRPTVEQYDQRAASFEKIKNFNAALKDGRQMIRVDQQDIKGYLRTGSILEKVGKPEKAIGIYKYGMERVPVLNKNFKVYNLTLIGYRSLPFLDPTATARWSYAETVSTESFGSLLCSSR
jgi:F-box/TPR repeat protein Pof3